MKYVALILVLALGLIGGAYAYWTDTLVVDGAVATGTLEVGFCGEGEGVGDYKTGFVESDVENYMELNLAIDSEDEKKINLTINNLYPGNYNDIYGSALHFGILVKNEGSIPVKLGEVELVEDSSYSDIYKQLIGATKVTHLNVDGETKTESGRYMNALKNFHNGIKGAVNEAELEPGEYLYFDNQIYLQAGADNDFQGKNVEFSLTFNWVQFNEL